MQGVGFTFLSKKKKKQALLAGCGVHLLEQEEEKVGSSCRVWGSPPQSRRRKSRLFLQGVGFTSSIKKKKRGGSACRMWG